MEVQEISWRGRKKKEGEDKVNKGRLTNVQCSLTHEADIAVIEFKQVNAIPKQSQNVKFRSRAT
jgi:hypothetical protein